MDPATAIGLASAIVTLVDVGIRVTKRIQELAIDGDIPEAFLDIKTRLDCIVNTVERMRKGINDLSLKEQKACEEVVIRCFNQVSQLHEFLQRVTVTKGESRLRRACRAVVSLREEQRVRKIAEALRDNIQLLTFVNTTPIGKARPKTERTVSEPLPSYISVTGLFLVPFSRDEQFVGREADLKSIASTFQDHRRVAISGIGGIG